MKNSLKGKIFTLLTNNYEEISYAHMKYIKLQLSVKCILIFLVKKTTTLNTSAASNYYIYIYWV